MSIRTINLGKEEALRLVALMNIACGSTSESKQASIQFFGDYALDTVEMEAL